MPHFSDYLRSCVHMALRPGAYFTKLGLTNPGYKRKPGYINPVLYSLVYSVPLKPSNAQNGQIWRARIMKPRLQARARMPCKTHDKERRFLERDQSRRGQHHLADE